MSFLILQKITIFGGSVYRDLRKIMDVNRFRTTVVVGVMKMGQLVRC